ncbi:MAG: OmpH family outer membrane protein [Chitinophagales bacterium]
MKKTVLAVVVALLAFAESVNAQQKIGHINSVSVLQAMPEFATMQADLQKQKDAYTKALEAMYADYEKKQKEVQAKSQDKTTPDAILETLIQDLQQTQQRIGDFENKVNDELQKLQQDKLKPINDKYLKAVKEVAVANGYSYVIDIVSGAVAYYPEEANDVTDLVMKKLGITAAPAPANTTAPKGK